MKRNMYRLRLIRFWLDQNRFRLPLSRLRQRLENIWQKNKSSAMAQLTFFAGVARVSMR